MAFIGPINSLPASAKKVSIKNVFNIVFGEEKKIRKDTLF